MFITFEGGEGAGKSTLALRLLEVLRSEGKELLLTREPGGTALGEEVRALLLHRGPEMPVSDKAELFLFLAARCQHIEMVIQPALSRGGIVLCDRFSDSTIAYQGAGKKMGMEYVASCCKLAAGGLEPDLTFLVDLDPEVGLKRVDRRKQNNGKRDRLEQLASDFHTRVRKGFLQLAESFPERIVVLDGTKSPDFLFKQAYEHLSRLLRK